MKQKSIKKEVLFSGLGVHSGLLSSVLLKPSEVNTGIIFVNAKNPEHTIKLGTIIPQEAVHASVIKDGDWIISTMEHLMAAVSALNIDNLIIQIDGIEVPILDGSAISFVEGIKKVGLIEQNAKKSFLTPKDVLKFSHEDRFLEIYPAKFENLLYFDYLTDFKHPLIGKSKFSGVVSPEYFEKEIAPARTFGFLEQLPLLRRQGLAKGTTLGNTVVIGEDNFLNDRRFPDEFIRHKFLDLLGDIALLGKNLVGSIKAERTGHNFNRLIIKHYIEHPELWVLI